MTNFLQLVAAGLSLGAVYSLIALGFSVVIRATRVLNFSQGVLATLGGYFAYEFNKASGVPFAAAVALAIAATVVVAVIAERVLLRHLVGKSVFTAVMMTIALSYILEEAPPTFWDTDSHNLGDPWGVSTYKLGSVVIPQKDAWTLLFAAVTLAGFVLFFRYTKYGLAMRACAIDTEAAAANGISPQRISTIAWGISGGVAALGGVCLAAGASGVTVGIGDVALAAFPAVIVGGLNSPVGAVISGLLIGVVQTLSSGYAPESLGAGFPSIVPYLVMLIVLVIRPHGLFGAAAVDRA